MYPGIDVVEKSKAPLPLEVAFILEDAILREVKASSICP